MTVDALTAHQGERPEIEQDDEEDENLPPLNSSRGNIEEHNQRTDPALQVALESLDSVTKHKPDVASFAIENYLASQSPPSNGSHAPSPRHSLAAESRTVPASKLDCGSEPFSIDMLFAALGPRSTSVSGLSADETSLAAANSRRAPLLALESPRNGRARPRSGGHGGASSRSTSLGSSPHHSSMTGGGSGKSTRSSGFENLGASVLSSSRGPTSLEQATGAALHSARPPRGPPMGPVLQSNAALSARGPQAPSNPAPGRPGRRPRQSSAGPSTIERIDNAAAEAASELTMYT